jgi:SP family myo-inositol transporter-like MFS transporter 13
MTYLIDETGITAAALISIGTSLSGRPLTSFDKSMITSSPSLFALFASPVASVLADRIGRKQVLLYASLLFIVGSLLQATAPTVGLAILGRSILGLSSGASGTTVPVYIVETAPPLYRGTLVTASILLVIVGQMLGFGVAGICAVMFSPSSSWRWTVAFGIGPALLQAGLIFFVMPDTPRWLIMVGRLTTAERVVQALYGDDRDTLLQSETMFEAIQRDVKAQQEERQTQLQALTKRGDWRWIRPWKLLLSQARYRRAMTISCLLVGLQQFCGFVSPFTFFRMSMLLSRVHKPKHPVWTRETARTHETGLPCQLQRATPRIASSLGAVVALHPAF